MMAAGRRRMRSRPIAAPPSPEYILVPLPATVVMTPLVRSFIENAGVGVYRSTPEGRIVMANPALLRIMGFDSFEEMALRNLESEGYEVVGEAARGDGSRLGVPSRWSSSAATSVATRIETRAWLVSIRVILRIALLDRRFVAQQSTDSRRIAAHARVKP